MDARRLVLLATARVPVAFIEKGAMKDMKETIKRAKKGLSEKELKIVEEYVKKPTMTTPPEVKGKR